MSLCEARKKDNRVCGAHALRGSQYCFMHEPSRAAERLAVQKIGGSRRGAHTGDMSSLPGRMRTIEDILALLDYTRDELLSLHNGIPRAKTLIALAGEYIHTIEMSALEMRLQALEEVIHVKAR